MILPGIQVDKPRLGPGITWPMATAPTSTRMGPSIKVGAQGLEDMGSLWKLRRICLILGCVGTIVEIMTYDYDIYLYIYI